MFIEINKFELRSVNCSEIRRNPMYKALTKMFAQVPEAFDRQ